MRKAAVFILLGQSNAVGHDLPMVEEDKITTPLTNVFGLSRTHNQSYTNRELIWSGYTSCDMNLAEEQDHTYSIANCLARLWQDEIELQGNADLPDLYIIHIAIGAQGISEGYMWHPEREEKLISGKLWTVDISLTPFTAHILSLVKDSFGKRGLEPDIIGIHWRGGEEDFLVEPTKLRNTLKDNYSKMLNIFYKVLGEKAPAVLHRLVCIDRTETDTTKENLHFINRVFEELAAENENISVYDVRNVPMYVPDVRGNGIFKEDAVHFTAEVNRCVAEEILHSYYKQLN